MEKRYGDSSGEWKSEGLKVKLKLFERAQRGALIAALPAAICLAPPFPAAAACGATGSTMLGLYLALQDIGRELRGCAPENPP